MISDVEIDFEIPSMIQQSVDDGLVINWSVFLSENRFEESSSASVAHDVN
jgi:hypothetical protein